MLTEGAMLCSADRISLGTAKAGTKKQIHATTIPAYQCDI